MAKRKEKPTPKNLAPGLIAHTLTPETPNEVYKQQLAELGFRVWRGNRGSLWKAKAQFGKLVLRAEAPTLGELVAGAQCIWTGLHE